MRAFPLAMDTQLGLPDTFPWVNAFFGFKVSLPKKPKRSTRLMPP
jgi:hypothetical protein